MAAVESSMKPSKGKAAPFKRVIVSDFVEEFATACAQRLQGTGIDVLHDHGAAVDVVNRVVEKLPMKGLHLVYLDPYNLRDLPFSIIKALSIFPSIDLLIHFSSSDVNRNMMQPSSDSIFENFAPGWCEEDPNQGKAVLRHKFRERWVKLLEGCRFHVSERAYRMENSKNAELYQLVVASKHPLGAKLWNSFRVSPQGELKL